MKRPVTPIQTAMGPIERTVPASLERRCILSSSTHCQHTLWCHDKIRLQKARVRAYAENQAGSGRPDNASAQRVRAEAVLRDRSSASSSVVELAWRQRNPESQSRGQTANPPKSASHPAPARWLGLSPLQYLLIRPDEV